MRVQWRRLPRPRTLRARLTVGLVVGCVGVGRAAVIEPSGLLDLRKKADVRRDPVIHTVRGAGCALRPVVS